MANKHNLVLMDEVELCINYRAAKYKKMQIGILAELNRVPVSTVKQILRENGLMPPEEISKEELDGAIAELKERGMVIDFNPVLPKIYGSV